RGDVAGGGGDARAIEDAAHRGVPTRPDLSPMTRDASDLPFEIRPSPMQGLGAFATRHIPAGVRLIEYAGERLTPAEADARYPDDDQRHHTFLFAIDDDVVIDAAVDGNDARFINHSCDPNCDAVIDDGRIWIET